MELAALVVVNVVTGFVMYILFSMRYTRAIKNRDQGIVDSMRAIADETRKTSLDILDLVQHKQESVYLLTRRADELLNELNSIEKKTSKRRVSNSLAINEDVHAINKIENKKVISKNSKKKTLHKRTSTKNASLKNTKSDNLDFENKNNKSKKTPKPEGFEHLKSESLGNDIYFERALAAQREDSLEIQASADTSMEAYQKGRLTTFDNDGLQQAQFEEKKIPLYKSLSETQDYKQDQDAPSSPGVLFSLGRFVKKIMGAENTFSKISESIVSTQSLNESENANYKPETKKENFARMLKKSSQESSKVSPKQKSELLPKLDRWVPSDSILPEVQDKVEISGHAQFPPLYSSAPPKIENNAQVNLLNRTSNVESLKSQEQNEHEMNIERKSEKIRYMLEAGYKVEDIISLTKATISEIELIQRFPATKKPRKFIGKI